MTDEAFERGRRKAEDDEIRSQLAAKATTAGKEIAEQKGREFFERMQRANHALAERLRLVVSDPRRRVLSGLPDNVFYRADTRTSGGLASHHFHSRLIFLADWGYWGAGSLLWPQKSARITQTFVCSFDGKDGDYNILYFCLANVSFKANDDAREGIDRKRFRFVATEYASSENRFKDEDEVLYFLGQVPRLLEYADSNRI